MSASKMVFTGGPMDGRVELPVPGFPAPDGYLTKANGATRAQYVRVATIETEDGVEHLYEYRGEVEE